jgi:hypothetical protein
MCRSLKISASIHLHLSGAFEGPDSIWALLILRPELYPAWQF